MDCYIELTGKLSVGGNINSLLSPDESVYNNIDDYTTFESANIYAFSQLFYGQSSLVDVSLLKLNTNKLAQGCYINMFNGCTSLTQAPKLQSTNLANECYYNMFSNCTSLTQAPELPATTLVNSCYINMFFGCTSLNYIKCLATDISAEYCTLAWTTNVSDQGEFHCKPNVAWPEGSQVLFLTVS